MTSGKPKQTADSVRCLNCGSEYRDYDIIFKHAGRTEGGALWNSKCPECGQINMMRERYAEMSDEEFRAEQHDMARTIHQ